MTALKGQPIFTKGLKDRKKRKRKASEGKVENNKSDEQKAHKLKIVSDSGNTKQ
jgi:hypothetical protein